MSTDDKMKMCLKMCLKCGSNSGNDWSQCEGSCPVLMSPHYSEAAAQQIESDTRRWLEDLKKRGQILDYDYDPKTGLALVKPAKVAKKVDLRLTLTRIGEAYDAALDRVLQDDEDARQKP